MATGGICLIVTTDFSASNVLFFGGDGAGQTSCTSFACIKNKRSAETRDSHHLIWNQNGLDHQTLDVAQPHIFVSVTEENDAPLFLTEYALRLKRERETINLRIAD